jgi:flagellar protein FliL
MADTPEAANSAKNPLVTVLLLVNVVAMGAIGFMQYRFMQLEAQRPDLRALLKNENTISSQEAEGESKKTVLIKKDNLLPLEAMTVNLSSGDGPRRHAMIEAVLKLSDDAKSAEFEARKPQIRDTIISIINTKRPEDLLKKEGKQFLKEEIKASINSFLVDGAVEDIFYISFTVN